MQTRFFLCAFAVGAAVTVAACSGGGGSPSAVLPPPPAVTGATSAPAKSAAETASVTIRVSIPSKTSDAAMRGRHYISPSTESMSISTGSGVPTIVNLTPSSLNCTGGASGTTCTVIAGAPVGTDSFGVTTFDALGGKGNALSSATATATIVVDTANTLDLVLDGIVASMKISFPSPQVPACTATTEPVTVAALDADGNTIVGAAPYDKTIALKYVDATSDSTLTGTTVTKPGDGASITYDGKYEPGGTLTATAAGVPSATATFYPVPTVCKEYALTTAVKPAGLNYIRAGSDGNIYWTEEFTGTLGHIVPSGTLKGTEVETPLVPPVAVGTAVPMTAAPNDLVTGPDGKLWVGDVHNGLDTFDPSTMLQANYGSGTAYPLALANGPASDGRIWFTDSFHHMANRVTTAGVFGTPIPLPNLEGSQNGIVAGPDGAMWITEPDSDSLDRVTVDGATVNEFSIGDVNPNDGDYPNRIVVGSDKNLWFTETGNDHIGRVTPNGTNAPTIKLFPLPVSTSISVDIAAGPDGALYFTESTVAGDRIARITTDGTITEYPVLTSGATGIFGITVGPDNNIWFVESANGDGHICYLTI